MIELAESTERLWQKQQRLVGAGNPGNDLQRLMSFLGGDKSNIDYLRLAEVELLLAHCPRRPIENTRITVSCKKQKMISICDDGGM